MSHNLKTEKFFLPDRPFSDRGRDWGFRGLEQKFIDLLACGVYDIFVDYCFGNRAGSFVRAFRFFAVDFVNEGRRML